MFDAEGSAVARSKDFADLPQCETDCECPRLLTRCGNEGRWSIAGSGGGGEVEGGDGEREGGCAGLGVAVRPLLGNSEGDGGGWVREGEAEEVAESGEEGVCSVGWAGEEGGGRRRRR